MFYLEHLQIDWNPVNYTHAEGNWLSTSRLQLTSHCWVFFGWASLLAVACIGIPPGAHSLPARSGWMLCPLSSTRLIKQQDFKHWLSLMKGLTSWDGCEKKEWLNSGWKAWHKLSCFYLWDKRRRTKRTVYLQRTGESQEDVRLCLFCLTLAAMI